MALLRYERRTDLALITLERADRQNVLSRELLTELETCFHQVEKDRDLRVVILTGASDRAFSAGTDISELATLDEDSAREVAARGQHLCDQIERCPVPVIAAVNGIAAGGGCELALACHLRVASSNATFSLPEIKLGLIPGYGGTQRLAREMGYSRAVEVMLTGQSIEADQALRIGLVNKLAHPSTLLAETESLAEEIAKMAPLAVRACLRAVVEGFRSTFEEGMALEAELFAGLFGTNDMREGTRAFLEKRAPHFTGS